jgi:hypothetical protein
MTAKRWTKDAVLNDAKQFASKTEWSRAGSAYVIAHRNGWLDEACAHMQPKWEHKWSKPAVLGSARKYIGRAEWKTAEPGAYKAALRLGLLAEACAHMRAAHRDWTLQALQDSAASFGTRGAWKAADGAAYKTARERGVLDCVCAHMTWASKPDGWWTKARVLASAKEFRSIATWNDAETSAYQMAKTKGWMEEATSHMDAVPMPIGPATIHEFLMTHGIPYKTEHRFREHTEVARMPFDFFVPQHRLLIEYHGRQHAEGWSRKADSREEIQRRDAIKERWVATSRYELVLILAWRSKTPQAIRVLLARTLGVSPELPRKLTAAEEQRLRSGLAWTVDGVMVDARQYQSRAAWMRASSSAYRFAIRHGMSDAATRHMKYVVEHGKWTNAAVLESARKFETATEWRKNEYSAYVIACRKGWKGEACAHMRVTRRPNGYWTPDMLLTASKRFKTVGEWRRRDPASYSVAKRRKLVPSTMARELVHGQWTKSRIATVASVFETRGQFRKGSPSAYTIAATKGWLADVCLHMETRSSR